MAIGTGNPAPSDPRPVSAFASQDTITKRVDAAILSQYRYPPAVPTRVTLHAGDFDWLPDGTTVISATLTWDASKDVLYDAQLTAQDQGGQSPVPLVQANVKSGVVFKNLKPEAWYTAQVLARHPVSGYASAWSPGGGTANLKMPAENSVMLAPDNMTIQASPQTGSIVVSWSPAQATYYTNAPKVSRNLKEYIIYRGTSANPTAEYARSKTNHFEDTAVTLGTTYHYRVKTNNTSDHSSVYSADAAAVVYSIRPLPDLNGGVADGAQITNTPGIAYSRALDLSGVRRFTCTIKLQMNSGNPTGVTIQLKIGSAVIGTATTGTLGAYPAITTIILTSNALAYTGSQTIDVYWNTVGAGLSLFAILQVDGASALPS